MQSVQYTQYFLYTAAYVQVINTYPANDTLRVDDEGSAVSDLLFVIEDAQLFGQRFRRIGQHGEFQVAQVGMIGLAFKSGTDDLRESPLVLLAEHLIGKGLGLLVYDPEVQLSNLLGANRRFIETHVPHIGALMRRDLDEVIEASELLVVGLADARTVEVLGQRVREVTFRNKKKLRDKDTYTVAANSYMVSGGSGFSMLPGKPEVGESQGDLEVLELYLKRLPQPVPAPDTNRWQEVK